MKDTSEIKLESKISELLALSNETNAEIADKMGISGATLSAYRQGQARPSFDSLVSMSEVFDVSLDYLVFGENADSSEINAGPVVRYMGESLQDSQLRQAQRISMVSNVGHRISQKLDEEIENYLSDSSTQQLFSGTMSNPQVLALEENSVEIRLLLKSFHYNLLDPQTETPGKFFTTVVKNLSQGHTYRYLLPANSDDWVSVVDSFRDLLIDNMHSEATVRNNCKFRVTNTPTITGCGLYRLDMEELRSEHPVIYDFLLEHDYCSDRWVGYTIGPAESAQGTMVMDTDHLKESINIFEYLWEKAEPI
ncbi:helix-turn-helix domain-containing protein [Halocatena salina]|uniref:Helix-turn-helix domain-containing protein n=1 Tax=Halocatena salina TaxID=2934340 RepID=A0A8U0A1Z0_9EURY|nr:helix-turn-helix transcriptional regulator [Halocatena salina]UPM43092.1 helix-turn-helix domain-containing protein [Halocatena salina]